MTVSRHEPTAPTRIHQVAAGGGIDAHWHDDHQIVYTVDGVLAVTTEHGSWVAPWTRAIWVPAGAVHSHRAYGALRLHVIGLAADDNPLGLTSPTVLAVNPLLRELLVAYAAGGTDPAPARDRLRLVMLDQLRASPVEPLHVPSPTSDLLIAVCDVVRSDFVDSKTLAELGNIVGSSERALSRLFRTELQMTFPQWRTQARLEHSLGLLAQGYSVTGVAHRCGWSSTSSFIDVFRRTFGHTPGTYSPS